MVAIRSLEKALLRCDIVNKDLVHGRLYVLAIARRYRWWLNYREVFHVWLLVHSTKVYKNSSICKTLSVGNVVRPSFVTVPDAGM